MCRSQHLNRSTQKFVARQKPIKKNLAQIELFFQDHSADRRLEVFLIIQVLLQIILINLELMKNKGLESLVSKRRRSNRTNVAAFINQAVAANLLCRIFLLLSKTASDISQIPPQNNLPFFCQMCHLCSFVPFFSPSDSRSLFCHPAQNFLHYHALTRVRPLFLSLLLCLNVSSTNPNEEARARGCSRASDSGWRNRGEAGRQGSNVHLVFLAIVHAIYFVYHPRRRWRRRPRGCILRDCSHGIPTLCHSLIGRSRGQDVR